MEQLIPTTELKENEIIVMQADSPREMLGRLNVVTERYAQEGYLKDIMRVELDIEPELIVSEKGFELLQNSLSKEEIAEFMEEGLLISSQGQNFYLDKYHWQSIQFVAKGINGYLGSVRIIVDSDEVNPPVYNIPTLTKSEIKIDDEWYERVKPINAELSQFAKLKEASSNVPTALLRIASIYSKEHGIKEWLATTDNIVVRILNGMYFNFNLPKIGPSVEYLGSKSTPIYINIENALFNAEQKDCSRPTAQFLRGRNDIDGFEWYTGK